jgi:hypothetical protein
MERSTGDYRLATIEDGKGISAVVDGPLPFAAADLPGLPSRRAACKLEIDPGGGGLTVGLGIATRSAVGAAANAALTKWRSASNAHAT